MTREVCRGYALESDAWHCDGLVSPNLGHLWPLHMDVEGVERSNNPSLQIDTRTLGHLTGLW